MEDIKNKKVTKKRKVRKNKHLTLVRCSITLGCTWWEDKERELWKFQYGAGSPFCTHREAGDPQVTMSIVPEMLHYLAERELNGVN